MLAFRKMMEAGQLAEYPIQRLCGRRVRRYRGRCAPCWTCAMRRTPPPWWTLNCVMDDQGRLIEIQGTGEERPFTLDEQRQLVELCEKGIRRLPGGPAGCAGGVIPNLREVEKWTVRSAGRK